MTDTSAERLDDFDYMANRVANGHMPGNARYIFSKDDWIKFKLELAAHDKALLDRVKTEVIGEDEVFIDLPIVDHTGKTTSIIGGSSYTPHMAVRNNLRAKQLAVLNALLPSGGVEGETE